MEELAETPVRSCAVAVAVVMVRGGKADQPTAEDGRSKAKQASKSKPETELQTSTQREISLEMRINTLARSTDGNNQGKGATRADGIRRGGDKHISNKNAGGRGQANFAPSDGSWINSART